jgi:ribosomal subunit interface protein
VEIVVSGRHTEVPERFRRLAVEKLVKVEQLAPKAHRTDVELSHEKNPRQSQNCERVEITVRGKGPVIRAEASAEDPAAALDIAFGRLLERLRRHRDRRKVHHGRQTPPSVRVVGPERAAGAAAPDGAGLEGAGLAPATLDGSAIAGDSAAPASRGVAVREGELDVGDVGLDDAEVGDGAGSSPIVIRTKEHRAAPMSLEQALYEMELVGHDFYLFVDGDSGRPCVVYRRRGWSYGVIRLTMSD